MSRSSTINTPVFRLDAFAVMGVSFIPLLWPGYVLATHKGLSLHCVGDVQCGVRWAYPLEEGVGSKAVYCHILNS